MIDKANALKQMDVLAKRLNRLDLKVRDLRVEYWRLQAIAYPDYECNHPDTHFCKHCSNNMEAVHE